jgi:hypothetical protein
VPRALRHYCPSQRSVPALGKGGDPDQHRGGAPLPRKGKAGSSGRKSVKLLPSGAWGSTTPFHHLVEHGSLCTRLISGRPWGGTRSEDQLQQRRGRTRFGTGAHRPCMDKKSDGSGQPVSSPACCKLLLDLWPPGGGSGLLTRRTGWVRLPPGPPICVCSTPGVPLVVNQVQVGSTPIRRATITASATLSTRDAGHGGVATRPPGRRWQLIQQGVAQWKCAGPGGRRSQVRVLPP